MTKATCSVDGCELPARSNGMCPTHYIRERRNSAIRPRCSDDGCQRASFSRGMCFMHYQRAYKAGLPPLVPQPRKPSLPCIIDGCHRLEKRGARGLCHSHYYRFLKHGDVFADVPVRPRQLGGHIDAQGYAVIKVDGRVKKEHRHVMEQMVGRPLHKFENVHHINGIRHDNRPENLELWTKAQPCGQRPEDLARWVVENYREYVEAALSGQRQMQLPT